MLTKSMLLKFYKRKDIQEAMLKHAQDKEIGIMYGPGFGKRPDILSYPRDILELALRNSTSFHASEERWSNPLALNSNLKRKDLDELRIGWDLVLDIDCKIFEYSRICADLVVKFLKYMDVKNISCKFSGNKGFHLGVPFESFPEKVGDKLTKNLFPDAPKKIALYVTENIKEELSRRILAHENNDFNQVKAKVEQDDIIKYEEYEGNKVARLDIEKFLEIDTVLISSRHLYRMPYSFHEKSCLVSLPIDPDKVMEFEKSMAKPESILTSMFVFLNRDVTEECARQLLVQALDFEVKIEEDREIEKKFEELNIESPIKEELFPPCIKKALMGMEDGRKRAIFCMSHFLGKIGWSKHEIETYLKKWNTERNPESLREVYLKGQLNHFKPGEKLPPNCSNEAYYKGLQICNPDGLCGRIKNPVNYTIVKWKKWLREKEEQEKRETREKKKEEREEKKLEDQKKKGEEIRKMEKDNSDKEN